MIPCPAHLKCQHSAVTLSPGCMDAKRQRLVGGTTCEPPPQDEINEWEAAMARQAWELPAAALLVAVRRKEGRRRNRKACGGNPTSRTCVCPCLHACAQINGANVRHARQQQQNRARLAPCPVCGQVRPWVAQGPLQRSHCVCA